MQIEKVAKEFLKEWNNPKASRYVLPLSGGLFTPAAAKEWKAKDASNTRWGGRRMGRR